MERCLDSLQMKSVESRDDKGKEEKRQIGLIIRLMQFCCEKERKRKLYDFILEMPLEMIVVACSEYKYFLESLSCTRPSSKRQYEESH